MPDAPIMLDGVPAMRDGVPLQAPALQTQCCCEGCPFYYQGVLCNAVIGPCPVFPEYAFVCSTFKGCTITAGTVVRTPGGACYKISTAVKYVPCSGPPPAGFACLPPGAFIITTGTCLPFCENPVLCPPIQSPPNAHLVLRACACEDQCGGVAVATISYAAYQAALASGLKCPFWTVIVDPTTCQPPLPGAPSTISVCAVVDLAMGCVPPGIEPTGPPQEGGCCQCCFGHGTNANCVPATYFDCRGSITCDGENCVQTEVVELRHCCCQCASDPFGCGKVTFESEFEARQVVGGCTCGQILQKSTITGSYGAGGTGKFQHFEVSNLNGAEPDGSFCDCKKDVSDTQTSNQGVSCGNMPLLMPFSQLLGNPCNGSFSAPAFGAIGTASWVKTCRQFTYEEDYTGSNGVRIKQRGISQANTTAGICGQGCPEPETTPLPSGSNSLEFL